MIVFGAKGNAAAALMPEVLEAVTGALGPRGFVQGWLEPLGVQQLPSIYGYTGASPTWLVGFSDLSTVLLPLTLSLSQTLLVGVGEVPGSVILPASGPYTWADDTYTKRRTPAARRTAARTSCGRPTPTR